MKPLFLPLIASALLLLLPPLAFAQQQDTTPKPIGSPTTEPPSTLPPGTNLEPVPAATPVQAAQQNALPGLQPTQPEEPSAPTPRGTIRVNFQGASLNDVLNYLSEAAGFVIVKDGPVTGSVDITSRQPITPDEAVDLLNTVLVSKGYAAIRMGTNGRILKIVNKNIAAKSTIPLRVGSNPQLIPPKDEIVTQILPVKYVDAAKLIDNLRPLLSQDAQVSANDNSNAIIMVDTQANIRRIAEIINALDTSVAAVSSIRIFPLKFADATQLANVITQLFSATQQTTQTGGGGGGGFGGRGGGFGGFGGRGGGGGGGGGATAAGGARQPAKVVAVADTQSNSIIVSAPDDVMPAIEDIITRTDTNITDATETQLFQLKHADATEMASILTSLYSGAAATQTAQNTGGRGQGFGGFGGQGGFGGFGGRGGNAAGGATNAANTNQRALQQSTVVAVADARTNTVLVTASHETMIQIAQTVGRLDASTEKKQVVKTHILENADPDNVAAILQSMFSNQGAATTTQPGTSRLTNRITQGASSDITSAASGVGGGSTIGGR